ncbi:hypothetical protein GCM10009668_23780 [Nocardioides dubius]|uniref:SnoaL-like domain-containing protein n=1 Tax=Nocardioides dubius TaxID=317019 RepID=A0ABP4EIN6_9ACTN
MSRGSDPGTRAWECVVAGNVLHTFATAVDAQDLRATLACFRPDAILETPSAVHRGHQEIAAFFTEAWRRDPSDKRHFVTAPRVTWIEPGLVRLETYFCFTGRLPDQSILGWGEYDDLVDVSGDEPRFVRIHLQNHLRTDLAAGWVADE